MAMELRGSLNLSKFERKPNQPKYYGKCLIKGVEYRLKGWEKVRQDTGEVFGSVCCLKIRKRKPSVSPKSLLRSQNPLRKDRIFKVSWSWKMAIRSKGRKFSSWAIYVRNPIEWELAGVYRSSGIGPAMIRFCHDSGYAYPNMTHITARPYKDGEPDGLPT